MLMKEYLLIILFCTLSLSLNAQDVRLHSDIDSLYVMFEKWYDDGTIKSSFMTCTDFDEFGTKDGYVLRKGIDDNMIFSLRREIELLQESTELPMEVKCKMYFYSSDTLVNTICIDEIRVLLNGFYYKTTQGLRNIIDRIVSCNNSKNKVKRKITYRSDTNYKISGMDSVYSYLRSQIPLLSDLSEICDTLDITIASRVDRKGNTIFANSFLLKRKDNKCIMPEKILQHLNEMFKNMVKWNPNNERTKFDILPTFIRIVVRED